MENSKIIKNNELIAKFMGVDVKSYHNSWDWLIPIYSKIMTLPDDPEWNDEYLKIQIDFENSVFNDRVDFAYQAVVEFIKWYNENVKVVIEDN